MYSLGAVMATTKRILLQLRRDPRTVLLIFIVPCILLVLLRWLYSDNLNIFNSIAPALLGIFPFIIMFLITSITTLRERNNGTMERLMVTPITKLSLVIGYLLAFGLIAIVQSLLAGLLLIYGLDLNVSGPSWFILVTVLATGLLGTSLGIFTSAFAKTEFQAIQFMPALILPQILIGGLLMPLTQMPSALEFLARCLPLTYVIDALNLTVTNITISMTAWWDLLIVLLFTLASILLASLTLRRQTK